MKEISVELKNLNLREFYATSLNILRDYGKNQKAINLTIRMKEMEKMNVSNEGKRNYIISVLNDTF